MHKTLFILVLTAILVLYIDIITRLDNIEDVLLKLKDVPDTLDVKFPPGMSTTIKFSSLDSVTMDSTTADGVSANTVNNQMKLLKE